MGRRHGIKVHPEPKETNSASTGTPSTGSPSAAPSSVQDGVPGAAPASRSNDTRAADGPKRKLIYILGTGRCGSTVFEIVLGSHPAIRAMGEFFGTAFPRWTPGAICSCGLPYDKCTFWSGVLEEYARYVDLDEQSRGQSRFETYPSLLRMWVHRLFGTASIRRHSAGMADLVRVVAHRAGTEIVSESSKNAVRGYLYSRSRSSEFDVYYLHLVRDGRGYMYSKTTVPDGTGAENSRLVVSPWEITARWVVPNLLAQLLCSRPKDHYLRIRYEDFVARPVEVLREIGRFLGLDMGPVEQSVREGRSIPIAHLLGGNRLRFRPSITLESRFASVALESRQSRWAFWTLGGWMAYWYGYLRRAGPGRENNGSEGRSPTSRPSH